LFSGRLIESGLILRKNPDALWCLWRLHRRFESFDCREFIELALSQLCATNDAMLSVQLDILAESDVQTLARYLPNYIRYCLELVSSTEDVPVAKGIVSCWKKTMVALLKWCNVADGRIALAVVLDWISDSNGVHVDIQAPLAWVWFHVAKRFPQESWIVRRYKPVIQKWAAYGHDVRIANMLQNCE
jgi:hypothetical protein